MSRVQKSYKLERTCGDSLKTTRLPKIKRFDDFKDQTLSLMIKYSEDHKTLKVTNFED